MKKFVLAGLLAAGLASFGCTSQQVATAETDLAKVLQVTVDVLDNPKTVPQAEAVLSVLAGIAPPTGPVHTAIVDAQAALNAYQRNQGSVATVQSALKVVINLLEHQGSLPVGAVRSRKN